jgi:hypothetical protein
MGVDPLFDSSYFYRNEQNQKELMMPDILLPGISSEARAALSQ